MIKIGFISDIHFGRDGRGDFTIPHASTSFPSPNMEEKMGEELVTTIQSERPEYLFIAGDFTSVGSPIEFYYCEKKILDIASKSGISKNNIVWCTGNHDNDWSISKLYEEIKKNENFDDREKEIAIQKYAQIATSVVKTNIEELPWPHHKGVLPANGIFENEKMLVFIINSASQCIHEAGCDHGIITNKQLEWLSQQLLAFNDDKRWKIVLLHHHPFNYPYPIPGRDTSLLSDGPEFLELIGKGGVHLVLHGHRHHPRCKTANETGWKHPISFICAGSLSVCEKHRLFGSIPNTFHILELDEENIGQLIFKSFQYQPGYGWNLITGYDKTLPIDPIMRLGKIVDDNRIKEILDTYTTTTDPILSFGWDELNEDLQYRLGEDINQIAKAMPSLQEHFIVKAQLPTNLTLKRKEAL